MTLAFSESQRQFTDVDLTFAQELSHRAGLAIEKALANQDQIRLAEAERDALRQSTEWFRSLAEALPQIVRTADMSGQITYSNARWTEYTGLSAEGELEERGSPLRLGPGGPQPSRRPLWTAPRSPVNSGFGGATASTAGSWPSVMWRGIIGASP